MAKADTPAAIAAIAAQVQSVGQARAVLGRCSELLQQGYGRLDDIPSSVFESADVRGAAKDLLDHANLYASSVYMTLPQDDDSQAQQISAYVAGRVGAALETSRSALASVEDAAETQYWDFAGALRDELATVGSFAGGTLQTVVNAAAAGGAAFVLGAWPVVLAAVALVVWLVRSGALGALARRFA